MVNLTTTQVEGIFGELEYIEPGLKAPGVVEVGDVVNCVADGEADNA
jgi:hypothetical protein